MEEIVSILMRRDHISENEARNIVEQTYEEIQTMLQTECSITDIEDIIYYNLGLEPDYMEAFLCV